MLQLRKGNERGQSRLDWLKSYHSFSFADYRDPDWMGFGPLRVINEDFIQPNSGFGTHGHQDMEIITYVIHGALSHKDSMGNGSLITPGEIQRMSAGTGIKHSEFNHSLQEPVHLLQIWIYPTKKNLPPSYEQKKITLAPNQFNLIASDIPSNSAVLIHQRVNLYLIQLEKGLKLSQDLKNHLGWLQLIKGSLNCNQKELQAGDGLGLKEEKFIEMESLEPTDALFFSMAAD